VAMTSACIIFTVFFLGGSTYYVTELLGLAPSNPNDRPKAAAASEKDMEMVGLLSKHSSRNEDSENEDQTRDDNEETYFSTEDKPRQRKPGIK
jgi:hypothetical protein